MFVGLSTEITQKPTNTDFHKLEWRKRLCLEQTPLAFVMDPDKGTDSGFIFSLSLILQVHFFFFLIYFFFGDEQIRCVSLAGMSEYRRGLLGLCGLVDIWTFSL